jgi:hypothetical protein
MCVRSQKISVLGQEKIEGSRFENLTRNLGNVDMDKGMLKSMAKGAVKLHNVLGQGCSDSEAEELVPRSKGRNLMALADRAKDHDKGKDQTGKKGMPAEVEDLDTGIPHGKALCSQMDKNLLTLNSLLFQYKDSGYSNESKIHDVKHLTTYGEKIKQELQSMVVNRKVALDKFQVTYKKSWDTLGDIKSQIAGLNRVIKADVASTKGYSQ